MPARSAALSAKQLQAALQRLKLPAGSRAVALSGGPDSLALAALLAELGPLHAFIVNHGLRPEALREAKTVQRRARALGIKAHILHWTGDKPKTGVMAAARQARYRLIAEAAHKHGCNQVFLAHHADDQLETLAMRAAEGSGWQGMAGMPALFKLGNITFARPLLHVTKQQLVATCIARGLKAVDDPSNRNPRYTRARLRLKGELPGAKLWAAQRDAAVKRNQLLESLRFDSRYSLLAGWAEFEGMDADLLRVLLQLYGQEDKPIRQEALEALLAKLKAGKGATLAGCVVAPGLVAREASAIAPIALKRGSHHIWWDRRWQLSFKLSAPAVLAPLGKNAAWRQAKDAKWLEGLPGLARASVPALWQGEGKGRRLVAVLKGLWVPYYQPLAQVFVEK